MNKTPPEPSRRIISRELVVVIVVVGLAIMGMSLLGPVMPLYLTSIGVSPSVLGLMLATGMAGMVLGESSGGWLADRAGLKLPMLIGTFLCVPMLISFVFTRSIGLIFVIFFFWGIVRSALFGPGRGYIGTNVPLSHKATFMAIYATAMAASRSVGTFTSGFVADGLGYEWMFVIAAGIATTAGVLVIAGIKKNQTSKNASQPALALPTDPPAPAVPLYRHRPFIAQSVVAALYFAAIGVMPFLSLKASEGLGLPVTQVGVLFTIGAVVNAVLLIPMGRLADRRSKRVMMAVGLLITSAGMAGIAAATNFAQLAVVQIVGSAGGSMFGPAAVALLSENVPLRRQSTAMGIYGGCEDIGIIFGSAVGGVVWSSLGPTPTFLLIGTTPAALGAVMCFALLKEKVTRKTATAQIAGT
ncbi:MAG: hypothetical protein A2147_04535 [Chloroflexi bacterium RBG_16_57_8]|nr:MAG: hypothetical protein A2147_04535 [Chloroflexi bacterium RBG_16_57_8]